MFLVLFMKSSTIKCTPTKLVWYCVYPQNWQLEDHHLLRMASFEVRESNAIFRDGKAASFNVLSRNFTRHLKKGSIILRFNVNFWKTTTVLGRV